MIALREEIKESSSVRKTFGTRERGMAFVIFGVLSVTYVTSLFFRSSTGVIGPELMQELKLTPSALSVLAGVFFFALAAVQIPVGVLLDRVGPRLTIFPLMVIAVLGSLIFATADDETGLSVGRMLMGIGCSASYIGAAVVIARWFEPARFAGMVGILLAIGNVGALLATTPLALATEAFGWRNSFLVTAGATLLLAVAGFSIVRDAPPDHPFHGRIQESLSTAFRGVAEVFRRREFLLIVPVACANYPVFLTILGLWGAPYLLDVHGLDPVGRGNVLLVMSVALICGHLVAGQLDRLLDTRRGVVLGGLSVSLGILLVLALVRDLSLWQVTSLFALLGAFSAFNSVTLAHSRALFPQRLVGRVVASYNMSLMGAVAIVQTASGWLVTLFPKGADGSLAAATYSVVFLFFAAIMTAAIVSYIRLPDRRPSRDAAV